MKAAVHLGAYDIRGRERGQRIRRITRGGARESAGDGKLMSCRLRKPLRLLGMLLLTYGTYARGLPLVLWWVACRGQVRLQQLVSRGLPAGGWGTEQSQPLRRAVAGMMGRHGKSRGGMHRQHLVRMLFRNVFCGACHIGRNPPVVTRWFHDLPVGARCTVPGELLGICTQHDDHPLMQSLFEMSAD